MKELTKKLTEKDDVKSDEVGNVKKEDSILDYVERFAQHRKNFPLVGGRLYVGKRDRKEKLMTLEPSDIYSNLYILVNTKGVALIALKVEEEALVRIQTKPNFIVRHGDEINVIWLLKDYFPKKRRSTKSDDWLNTVMEELEVMLEKCDSLDEQIFKYTSQKDKEELDSLDEEPDEIERLFKEQEIRERTVLKGEVCLNPFCIFNKVEYLTNKRYRLGDLIKKGRDGGKIEKRRADGRKRKAEANARIAKARKAKSREKICVCIRELQELGRKVNQTQVAKYSRLSRAAVNRNWSHNDIQKLL